MIVCGVDQSEAAEAVEPAREAEAVLTSVRVQWGLGGGDDVRFVDGSPDASWPGGSP
jgi:hypothetical protein